MTLSPAIIRQTIALTFLCLVALLSGCYSISTTCVEIKTTHPSIESARSDNLEQALLTDVDVVARRWSFREANTLPLIARRYVLDHPIDGKESHVSIEARISKEMLRISVAVKAEQFIASKANPMGGRIFSDLMQEIGHDLEGKAIPADSNQ